MTLKLTKNKNNTAFSHLILRINVVVIDNVLKLHIFIYNSLFKFFPSASSVNLTEERGSRKWKEIQGRLKETKVTELVDEFRYVFVRKITKVIKYRKK